MHYVVAGPGALGSLYTSFLARGIGPGDSLQVLDHNPERARKLSEQGIVYLGEGESRTVQVDVQADVQDIRLADILFLCVKSYDLSACIQRCLSFLTENTLVIFLQNGISQLQYEEGMEAGIPVFGTTSEGANLAGEGRVKHAGTGITYFGFPLFAKQQQQKRLDDVLAALARGGMMVECVDDIVDRLWAKLMVNVGINGLTAMHDCQNGHLLLDEQLAEMMTAAVQEASAVAEMNGVLFDSPPLQLCEQVCQRTAENISSMLQDVKKKRRTEIDSINGVIVQEGKRLGISTPVNELIYQRVRAIEMGYGVDG